MKLTETAVKEINNIMANANVQASYLRVGIAGMRCSGPVYSFNLDEEYNESEDDLIEQDGLKIINEKTFTQALEPVVIDYAEIGDRRGFTFSNPLAVLGGCSSGGCSSGGCGSH